MSESADSRREAKEQARARQLTSLPGGRLWTADELIEANAIGVTPRNLFVPGDRFKLGSVDEYVQLGFANSSPDPTRGLTEYLAGTREPFRAFVERTASAPLRFGEDGLATYDPTAQRVAYDYQGDGDGWFHQIMPAVFGAFAGAGLAGLLPGTTSVFSGAAAAGAELGGASLGAEELFAGLNSLVPGGSGVAEAIAAGSTLTVPPGSGSLLDVLKTGASVASAGASVAQAASGFAQAAPAPRQLGGLVMPGTVPYSLTVGASDMTPNKKATSPATPAGLPGELTALLPIVVLAVAALALLGDLKGD